MKSSFFLPDGRRLLRPRTASSADAGLARPLAATPRAPLGVRPARPGPAGPRRPSCKQSIMPPTEQSGRGVSFEARQALSLSLPADGPV